MSGRRSRGGKVNRCRDAAHRAKVMKVSELVAIDVHTHAEVNAIAALGIGHG
jgi:hypothetical protein